MTKNRLIRNIFIVSLMIAFIFPLVNIYFVFPRFTSLLIENAEDEARRLGNHLSGMLLKNNNELTQEIVSDNLSLHKYQTLQHDFQLMKLKIFNPSGEILYSTSPEEIGQINSKEYFHEIVAKGNPYSKVVKKDAKSLEGQKVTVDVVETYVPIMRENIFYGAFEIYYDLSGRNQKLHDFVLLSSIITLILMFGYLMTLVFIIVRSDKRHTDVYVDGSSARYNSPFYSMLLIAMSLFIAETVVMIIISAFPPLSLMTEAVFDSLLLVVFVSPMLYFFMLRPLLAHIAELRKAKERISHMSFYDELTNLPNRNLFEDRLRQAILQAERYERKVAVFSLDLDNFKRINEIFEHRAGDRMLKEMSDRLISNLRLSDSVTCRGADDPVPTIARMGGDEFTILLTEIKSLQDVVKVAERIRNIMSQPFSINDQEVFITASIGIATYPVDGRNVESLLKNAHSATYYVKEHGRNNFQFYEGSMNESAYNRLILENDLRKALDNEEFILHYQPRIDLRSGKVLSMEALIRWITPDRGTIPPMEFIPLAEESGLIIPLGEWVLRKACEQRKAWQHRGLPDACISVNISGHQFQQQHFMRTISNILTGTGLAPELLELEITESIMMKGGEDALATLQELKEMGLRLAMDDFGTGYSSFSYLKSFPLDIIKIDKSFIKDITTNKDTEAIVEAIIAMAQRLHLKTVAEGVETEEQLAFLQKQGCDEIQGYLITPPLPAEEIYRFLSDNVHMASISAFPSSGE